MAGGRVPKIAAPRWRSPFRNGEDYPFGQPWGYDPEYGGNAQHFHWGLDWRCGAGVTVVAVADGVIVGAATEQPEGFPGVLDGAWGTVASLDVGGGLVADYCHLQGLLCYPGQRVRSGQAIGVTGATGIPNVTVFGPHLHLQVRHQGKRVDPTPYFAVY